MSVANRVIKNTGYLYAKMGITMFISLYTTRLILNALGAEDFGIYNIVGGAISMLAFLNNAMTTATQRFMSYAKGEGNLLKQRQIFNVSLIIHACIAMVMAIVAIVAGYFFFDGVLTIDDERRAAAIWVYCSVIISMLLTIINVPFQAILNARENMLFYSVTGIVESFLNLAIAFYLTTYHQDKLILYGILTTAIVVLDLLMVVWYCRKHYEECVVSLDQYYDKTVFKSMVSFAGWNFLPASTSMISQYGMSIALNNFFGAILNAAQGIANQISGQLMAFSTTMVKALNPAIAKSEGSGERETMLNATLMGAKYSFLLLGFFAVPFMLETPTILKIWLKTVPDWTILFTRLQLSRSLIEQLSVLLISAIYAQGEIKRYSLVKSIFYILPIILTTLAFWQGAPPYILYIFWISCWGIAGGVVILRFTKKKCGLSYRKYFNSVFVPCVGTLVMSFGCGLLPLFILSPSFLRIILVAFACASGFLLSYYFIFMSRDEKHYLASASKFVIGKFSLAVPAKTSRP